MPPREYEATVSAIFQKTHDVRELHFAPDGDHFEYVAGQYIAFKVPAEDKPKGVSRLYSICTSPSDEALGIVYNYVGGPGTRFLQALKEGDRVSFKGPFGKFVLDETSDRHVCLVATGTGVGPFRSILREQLERAPHRHFTLLWGVRHKKDLYYQGEFESLAAEYDNFAFCMTLTGQDEEDRQWGGHHGRVTALFPEIFPSVDNLEVYVCGNDAMIRDMKQICDNAGSCPFYREVYF